jgi:imidazolonepropionase-like amidohydrolase
MNRVIIAVLLLASVALAQNPPAQQPSSDNPKWKKVSAKLTDPPNKELIIRCATLWDGKSNSLRHNVDIIVNGEKIVGVGAAGTANAAITIPGTCLPGLIDTHTHVLLQGDITAEDYDAQLLKQSIPYRTILGTQSARKALEYGFTSIRDLETEGAMYADVDIRNAINKGVIPGPRMQVATRAMDVTGAYPLQGYNWEIEVPHGVQIVDGVEAGRKAVREQISHGADWIKVYSDRSYFLRPDGVLDDTPTFTIDELRAIVDEAHREHHRVASHAAALNGVHNSVEAGVDTVEHGQYIADADMKTMVQKGIWYVPTLYVGEYVAEGRAKAGAKVWVDMVKVHADVFNKAVKMGVKIAFGTDAGGYDWNINPAVEFPLMVKYGMTPLQALQSATVRAAELLNTQDQVGSIEVNKFADIIAVPGNPLDDVTVLQKANFVMKGGVVYKQP